MDAPYLNVLSISHRGKGIPYGASGLRPDGGMNYGFKDLKGHPELIDEIPEMKLDAALRKLVGAINARETGLFSIGCLSAAVPAENGIQYTGYVEFALNSRLAVADPSNYFPVYFHFDRLLFDQGFSKRVCFQWEVCPAHFVAARVDGYSVVVTINTTPFQSQTDAYACWEAALSALEALLSAIPARPVAVIYSPRL